MSGNYFVNCDWEEIDVPDASGRRRVQCRRSQCARISNPTRSPIERIFANCKAYPIKVCNRKLGTRLAMFLSAIGITKPRFAWLLWKLRVIESLDQGCGCEKREQQLNLWGYKLAAWVVRLRGYWR